jgi:hypothetical protein
MILNNSCLKKLEVDFPFTLSPEQKTILLLWFGADSKFGWSKLDFLIGILKVRHLYPNHRDYLYKGLDGIPIDHAFECDFDFDNYGNHVIRFCDGDDDNLPF